MLWQVFAICREKINAKLSRCGQSEHTRHRFHLRMLQLANRGVLPMVTSGRRNARGLRVVPGVRNALVNARLFFNQYNPSI